MRPLKWLCFLLLVSFVPALQAQVLEARVLDGSTRAPLAYASVAWGRGAGIITNEEGVFRIPVVSDGDTLTISYLGYQRSVVVVSVARALHDLSLFPAAMDLQAVEIVGRSDELIDLVISSARHLDRVGRYSGKVYYELGTRTDAGPVEAIECYYNGAFNGSDIEALQLKSGRIGLAPDHGRYVANLNTSRGFMLLHPTKAGAFPATPLQFTSRKALRRAYSIELLGTTHDQEELYHLRFTPKIDDGTFFSGELWIARTGATVRSLQLDQEHCARHPFLPQTPGAELRDLAVHYRQTYGTWLGNPVLSNVELDYSLTYHSAPDDPRSYTMASDFQADRRMHAHGVLHVFDPGASFILPLFEYDTEDMDYRKILAMPYDSVFWADAQGLVRTEQQEEDDRFFAQGGVLLGHSRSLANTGKSSFFESNYAFWSPTERIRLKESMEGGHAPPVGSAALADITADQLHLVVQLFVNIDEEPGGYRTFSATVFDGFRSYDRLREQENGDLLLNLYFDLCELERRAMQAKLDVPGLSMQRIKAIHAEAESNMERTTRTFLKEAHYGADLKAMARWNERVLRGAGVDNFKLFNVVP